ncbi:MAG: CDP-alcohol phosphatidyltransferase family protein [Pseudomonadota bacterium]
MTPQAHLSSRPLEIEEWSNRRLLHPAAAALVPLLARWRVSPNAVSLLGLASALLAALAYARGNSWGWALLGLAAMIAWHILDGADGKLARLIGRASAFGRLVDGVCDHLAFAAIYIALSLAAIRFNHTGSMIWLLVLAAGIAHAFQAAALEDRRQAYVRHKAGRIAGDKAAERHLVAAPWRSLLRLYDAAQNLVAPRQHATEAALEAARQKSAASWDAALAVYQDAARRWIARWSLLSANQRTLAIFIFVVMGWPAGYFWFELIVLSAYMAWLIAREPHHDRASAAAIAAARDG